MPIRDLPPRLLAPSSLDQLFAAPLKTFVAERKRLADQLKAAGEPQAAKELAKTPRPTVSAWIVNQLARQDGPLLREFAALTDRLRGAQGQTARTSDQSPSELLAAHREAIKRLRGRAEEILLASGQAVRPQILERVLRNLRVGMAEPDARPTIESGRLIEDVAAEEGFAGLLGRSDQAPTTAPRSSDGPSSSSDAELHDRPPASGKSDARSSAQIVGGDDPDGRARRAAAEVARQTAARASQEAQARTHAQAARAEAEVRIRTLQARADGARRSLEKVRRDADQARQALAQAEDDLRSAELAAQRCAKQLADAQAEIENLR